ncbi:MAG: hypothetical protein GKR94_09715 [Gammaproteobacteria bacterium]|nr:hypothetical protein [Gammaproteobacteria bacterium]
MNDPIVEEIRKAREDHSAKFNHDLAAICANLKMIEKDCGNDVVSLPPRVLTKASSRPRSSAAEA